MFIFWVKMGNEKLQDFKQDFKDGSFFKYFENFDFVIATLTKI
jgi:hypothetical protein